MAAVLAGLLALAAAGCGFRAGPADPPLVVAAGPAAGTGTPPYLINPGDELQISVWKEEGLDQKVVVRPDGMISFPLAGHLKAAGSTAEQVQTVLRQRLARFIQDPIVTVSASGTPGNRFYVIGQVQRPGPYSAAQSITVMQALTLAGGLTPFADEDDIIIIRKVEGAQRYIRFDYSKAKRGISLDQNITLESGDVVVVRE